MPYSNSNKDFILFKYLMLEIDVKVIRLKFILYEIYFTLNSKCIIMDWIGLRINFFKWIGLDWIGFRNFQILTTLLINFILKRKT